MLRITVAQDRDALFFVLEGRLVGPWVDELRTTWQQRTCAEEPVQLTVDLCGLTAMDTGGQTVLEELLQSGATLRCADVMNQYLVEQMGASGGGTLETCRPCQRFPNQADSLRAPASGRISPADSVDAA